MRQMKVWIDYLTKMSVTLAVIGFLMSFAISYRSYGLAEEIDDMAKKNLKSFKQKYGYEAAIRFSGGIGGTYDHFADGLWLALLVVWDLRCNAILLIRIRTSIFMPQWRFSVINCSPEYRFSRSSISSEF